MEICRIFLKYDVNESFMQGSSDYVRVYMQYDPRKGDKALIKLFEKEIYDNRRGFVISITGNNRRLVGVGKSYTGLKIGEQMDKYLLEDIDKKVVWTPKAFIEAINYWDNRRQRHTGETLPGQVVILDEAELLINNRTFYSFINRAILYILSTFRYKRGMAMVITPHISFVDVGVRKLMEYVLFNNKVLENSMQTVYTNPRILIKDYYTGNIYYKAPRIYNVATGTIEKLSSVKVGLPSEDLARAYEERARKFKDKLGKDLLKEIEKFEESEFGSEEDKKNQLDELAKKVLDTPELRDRLMNNGRVYLDDLRDEFGLTYSQARRLKRIIEKMWKGG